MRRVFVTDTLGNPYVEMEEWPRLVVRADRRDPGGRPTASRSRSRSPSSSATRPTRRRRRAAAAGSRRAIPPAARGPAAGRLAAAAGLGRRGARQAPPQPLRLFLAVGHLESVRDHDPGAGKNNTGVVCFITVAGFLNGPGFQKMRDYLRRTGRRHLGHRLFTRRATSRTCRPASFQAVQQPVCIVLVARKLGKDDKTPARVRFRALPKGKREEKFAALAALSLDAKDWIDCPGRLARAFSAGRSAERGRISRRCSDLFVYDGSGVMPGRTWIIAPDHGDVGTRAGSGWSAEKDADEERRAFSSAPAEGRVDDKHQQKTSNSRSWPATNFARMSVANDTGECHYPDALCLPIVRPAMDHSGHVG